MSGMNDVTLVTRVDSTNPGHTTVSVFVGRQPGARGLAGTLTFRTDEYEELFNPRHLIWFRDNGWTIQHPLQERLDGSLFDCPMANWDGGDIGYRGRYVLYADEDGQLNIGNEVTG